MKYGIGPAGRIYAAALIVAVLCAGPASEYRAVYAEDLSVLKGSITDVRGRPVEGAMVFVYVNSDVRRSAEFISAPADAQGRYRMTVPSGTYWVVARLKKTEGFGPLMPGDKHSGEPREVELLVGSDREADFVVADLRDAISMKKEVSDSSVRVSGTVTDERGSPVSGAYVIVNRSEEVSGIPDFLSAWVDDQGRFTLYVPAGRYFMGYATAFPPEDTYRITGEQVIQDDISDLRITVHNRNNSLDEADHIILK